MKTTLVLLALIFPYLSQAELAPNPKVVDLFFHGGKLKAHCEWTVGPIVQSESQLKITWTDVASGQTVWPELDPAVDYYMPDMEMIVDEPKVTRLQEKGTYRVSNIVFSMGKKWAFKVTIQGLDGDPELREFPLEFPAD